MTVPARALRVLPPLLQKHIKEHHEEVRERPCPHPGCNKVFMIDRYLQRHVKLIHTGRAPEGGRPSQTPRAVSGCPVGIPLWGSRFVPKPCSFLSFVKTMYHRGTRAGRLGGLSA